MSFSYVPYTPVFFVRSLIPDTNPVKHIFEDEEINGFLYLESSQGLYISGMANPTGANINVVPQVFSYRRAAAMAIDVIASDRMRAATVEKLLDVVLKSPVELHGIAESLREQEENIGNFAIAEMVPDQFAARERALNQLLRIEGGS